MALFNSWSATIFFAVSTVPSILNIFTFSLAEITLEELFTKTFSANNLNSESMISTLPVA